MLKLKEVELLGFKSFADKTRLVCDGSTAAVVGPNGCGKSNLADAVSWVLGEQSARMLRGERMSDVIFNGTGTRPPTGLAEVSMTLVETGESLLDFATNPAEPAAAEQGTGNREEGTLGLSPESGVPSGHMGKATSTESARKNGGSRGASRFRDGEIKVTRRLFRSGESEYLLNGEACRLRDIQDIFMGTGLGPESYAIIEQGRIGQILSSRPSDRRSIIEEAAGVSKFKSRKRLAEAKLESARQNLARIGDILEEISKQVNSLKRQASKAGRYRELQKELRAHQKRVYASRWARTGADFQKLHQDFAAVQESCSAAARQLELLEGQRNSAAGRLDQLEGELRQVRDAIAQSELEGERLHSRLEKSRQQSDDLNARSAEAQHEREQIQVQAVTLEQKAQEQVRRAQTLREEWGDAQETVRGLAAHHEGKDRQLGGLESEAEAQRQALLEAVSRAASLRNQAVQTEEMGVSSERQLARVRMERDTAEAEGRQLAAELETLEADHARHEGAVGSLEHSLAEAEASLVQARQDEAALREETEGLNREASRVSARKQALEEAVGRHAYTTDSVRRLLSLSSQDHGFRPLGVVADFLEVAPGYEDVVEEFFKAELDCVVVEKHEEARSGIALLESDGGGRSTFFIRHVASNGHGHESHSLQPTDAGRQPGVVASLQELVKLEPRLGLNGDLAFPILASSFIVEDGPTAERMAASYPSCHFLTRQGEHYHHRLVSGGKVSIAGPLALRRDLRELDRRAGELGGVWSDAERRWTEAQVRLERLDRELRRLADGQLSAEKQSVVSGEKLRQAREGVQRAADRVQVLARELALLSAEREKIEQRRASLQIDLDRARSDQEQRERGMAETAQSVRVLRAELDNLSRGLTEVQVKASALEERRRAADADGSRIVAEAAQAQERLAQLGSQAEAWSEEACRLRLEAEGIESAQKEAEKNLQALRSQLSARDEECRAARCRRDELIPSVEDSRSKLDAWREKRSETEVALARTESDLAHLAQQCREELEVEPASLQAEIGPEELFDGEHLGAAEQDLHELKARLERLGPVNMMALEELKEAEERLTFLETQRQDLLASINDTTQTIREIDDASRRKFMDAFKAINTFFAESFRSLFGGGVGEMRFSDEADNESGIDLVVQPPGKRLQNVLLLSGGEKALTALALLIAVFRFTPSPFCILDEVDAPLDDTNVIRFARMIQSMSSQTQFILITHNKRTMEACGIMYGVTMEEPGISKLISVRFEPREPLAIPA